jgi:uncharacterized protein (TIGR03067 family)
MTRHALVVLLVSGLITGFALYAGAASVKEKAIKKDRSQYQGTWRVVAIEYDGKKLPDKGARKITVKNHADGTWIIFVDGKEVGKGTSTIDPIQTPKTIDFLPSKGANYAKTSCGIYEINGQTRKLSFASPGEKRPTAFATKPGSRHCLVVFQRDSK